MATQVLEAPVKEAEPRPRSPIEELRELEEKALRLGMSPTELTHIRMIGDCPSQIQTRISTLRHWIASH